MATKILPLESLAHDELARLAGLQYVSGEENGILRQCNGSGFSYVNGRGLKVCDREKLRRIETLAVPPAWTDVWICGCAEGHLQATGRDARGRKQYIYHERWREMSNLVKFWRLKQCVRFMPKLRCQVQRDLRSRGLRRPRVLAGMIVLLDLTSIRVGNEEYVKQNNSYGLASLRTRHVTFEGRTARLHFRGKGGLQREAIIEGKHLVRLLKELKKLPGQHLFQYLDESGSVRQVDALTVNEYLRERTTCPFTAKDFRTWKASALAAGMLFRHGAYESQTARKRFLNRTVRYVAEELGNTPTVCRKYYIHTGLQDVYLAGRFPEFFGRFRPRPRRGLTADEQVLAFFLRYWPNRT